jgi:hypothetical protein
MTRRSTILMQMPDGKSVLCCPIMQVRSLRATPNLFCFPVEISAISKVQIRVNPVEIYSTNQSADQNAMHAQWSVCTRIMRSDCSGQLQTCSNILWKFVLVRKCKSAWHAARRSTILMQMPDGQSVLCCPIMQVRSLRSTPNLFCFPVEISAFLKVQIRVNPVENYSTNQSADQNAMHHCTLNGQSVLG